MPSQDEYVRGKWNLLLNNNEVDYIITHTVPRSIAYELVDEVFPGEEELQDYFQEVSEQVAFEKWYFGHWHMDYKNGKYVGLYDEIVPLETKNDK